MIRRASGIALLIVALASGCASATAPEPVAEMCGEYGNGSTKSC